MTDQPNDEGITWVQAFATHNTGLPRLVWVNNSAYNIIRNGVGTNWRYPDYVHHLHMGVYQERKQLTVIANGVDYGRMVGDELGERIASGTPDEMFEMLVDYARML